MPQGSWLGLLSFLVLINDISTAGCQYTNMLMTPSQNYYQNTPTSKCQLSYQTFLSGLMEMTWK